MVERLASCLLQFLISIYVAIYWAKNKTHLVYFRNVRLRRDKKRSSEQYCASDLYQPLKPLRRPVSTKNVVCNDALDMYIARRVTKAAYEAQFTVLVKRSVLVVGFRRWSIFFVSLSLFAPKDGHVVFLIVCKTVAQGDQLILNEVETTFPYRVHPISILLTTFG